MITTDTAVLLVARIPIGNVPTKDIPRHLEVAERALAVNHPNIELVLLTTRTGEADMWAIPLREYVEGSSDVKLSEEELAEFRKCLCGKLDQVEQSNRASKEITLDGQRIQGGMSPTA